MSIREGARAWLPAAQTPLLLLPTLPAWAPLWHLASCCALESARRVGRLCRGRFPVPFPHIPRGLLSPWMLLGLQTWTDGIISPRAAQNTAADSPAKWTVLTSRHYDSIIPSKSCPGFLLVSDCMLFPTLTFQPLLRSGCQQGLFPRVCVSFPSSLLVYPPFKFPYSSSLSYIGTP